jgi:hypothetical protein
MYQALEAGALPVMRSAALALHHLGAQHKV